jgi:hypothetical protein
MNNIADGLKRFADPHLRRPLPSFAQWLENSGGTRGDGFAEFTALVDLTERTLAQSPEGLSIEQACFLRLWQGMMVAVVELCNVENAKGVPSETIVSMMPRVLGSAALYGVASVVRDDAPFRNIAKILTEEFRAAAKMCADTLEDER